MIREKRIKKEPVSFSSVYKPPKMKNNTNCKNKRKSKRCQFKMIPYPSKFDTNFEIIQLFGDIFLVEKDGVIFSEISVLSKLYALKNVQIDKYFNTKLVRVTLEHKRGIKIKPWEQTAEKLEASDDFELNNWGFLIKNFSMKYQDFIKDLAKKNNKTANDENEKTKYMQITRETEEKKSILLKSFPCFCLKFRFDGTCIRLNEIVFNNYFLGSLGYSIDSFVTSVFNEGIPRFTSGESCALSDAFKALLENYFTLGREGFVTPNSDISFLLKNNYVRDAQIQAHLLLNYEAGFGIDMIVCMTSKDEPYMDQRILPKISLSKNFIREMIKLEQNQADFLSSYYSLSFTFRHADSKKICKIKELFRQPKEEEIDTFSQ